MLEILPKYNVEVKLVERKRVEQDIISASRVRNLLKEGNVEKVRKLLPKPSFDFLFSEEGEKVINKLESIV